MVEVIKVCRWCGCIIHTQKKFLYPYGAKIKESKNEVVVFCNGHYPIRIRIILGNCEKCRRR